MDRGEALALLKKHTPDDASWHVHLLQVSGAACCLAEVVSQRGHAVDVEKATVLGLLHDLGRSRGHGLRHGIEGYLLARAEGHQDEGRICLLHLLKGRSLAEGVELGMLTEQERRDLLETGQDYSALSLEEKVVCVADALMSDTGLVTVAEKYANARRRYGPLPHHYVDEAWVSNLAAELTRLLGTTPYEVLRASEVTLPAAAEGPGQGSAREGPSHGRS
jgi:uncharacterized protein